MEVRNRWSKVTKENETRNRQEQAGDIKQVSEKNNYEHWERKRGRESNEYRYTRALTLKLEKSMTISYDLPENCSEIPFETSIRPFESYVDLPLNLGKYLEKFSEVSYYKDWIHSEQTFSSRWIHFLFALA